MKKPQDEMRNGARHRIFHEALLRKLYPSQSDDDTQQVEQEQIIIASEIQNVPSEDQINSHVVDYTSESSENNGQLLPRAQRKRIRKRKLRELASHSKIFIGPLLPYKHVEENFNAETSKCLDVKCSNLQSQAEKVMPDAVKTSSNPLEGIESGSSTCHHKSKQRRLAKKLNHENAKSTQREQSSKAFMAESSEAGYVLKRF